MSFHVGYIFTEWPLRDLEERGFRFHEDHRGLPQGYRAYTAVFPDATGFQIREILDEATYKKATGIEHFGPCVIEAPYDLSPQTQLNSVFGLDSAVVPSQMEACELKTYLEIRKPFVPWALWLKCEDFALFCRRARPDRIFQWKNHQLALIHMGPSCFDLLVGEAL